MGGLESMRCLAWKKINVDQNYCPRQAVPRTTHQRRAPHGHVPIVLLGTLLGNGGALGAASRRVPFLPFDMHGDDSMSLCAALYFRPSLP
jgi:hypothetical protein